MTSRTSDLNNQSEADLRVSVIVTLTDERGQGRECVRMLTQGQTLAREKYEVIVITDGSYPQLAREAEKMLAPQDSLVHFPSSNEFYLYEIAARRARGRVLFFTEAHCVPEPECLEAMVRFLDISGCDGARCRSVRIDENLNYLAQMEDRVIEDFRSANLQKDHWLKVLIHGFGIHRDVYFQEGGFTSEFGQFAEWELAARLHSRGRRLGYAPEVVVRHCYAGDLKILFSFIRDFTRGEMKCRATLPKEFCEKYFGPLPEWFEHGFYNSALTRRLCLYLIERFSSALKDGDYKASLELLRLLRRFDVTALCGLRWHLLAARKSIILARLKMRLWRFSAERCYQAYHRHWAAIIQYCRLEFLADQAAALRGEVPATFQYDLTRIAADDLTGFYPLETWQGHSFRWSEPAAVVRVSLPAGDYEVRIEMLPVRSEALPLHIEVIFDGHTVCKTTQDSHRPVTFRLTADKFKPETDRHYLALLCNAFRPLQFDSTDERALGLPVTGISFGSTAHQPPCPATQAEVQVR
ncbi:MAG TPA: glycosyltransferase [Blastocatellia bacterium]|nr:glycosyltransferase [Blastocatellia bacterium]